MKFLRKVVSFTALALLAAYSGSYTGDLIPEITLQVLARIEGLKDLCEPVGLWPTKVWTPAKLGVRFGLLAMHTVAFGVAVTLGLRSGSKLFLPSNRAAINQAPKRTSNLLLFLSPPYSGPLQAEDAAPPVHMVRGCHLTSAPTTPNAAPVPLEQALQHLAAGKYYDQHNKRDWRGKPFGRWSWEQPLRSMWYHMKDQGPLQRVFICGSPQTLPLAPTFVRYLQYYFGSQFDHVRFTAIATHPLPDEPFKLLDFNDLETQTKKAESLQALGIEFEDHDALTAALQWTLDRLVEQGVSMRDVTIDCTGGAKITSIAAAAISFNRHIQVQYVPTSPDGGKSAPPPWNYTPRAYSLYFETQLKPDFM